MKQTEAEQRIAARKFAQDWANRGDEKQETQKFWLALLQGVFGVTDPNFIAFEVPVKLDHVSFIDGFIGETRVLIEQKGRDVDLRKGYKQSDGSMLTPYGQARRYAGFLPHDKNPRWIVVCNFQEFLIYDMNRPNDPPEELLLRELEKDYHRLNFLVDTGDEHIRKEMEVSLQAGEIVGEIYDALLRQYKNPGGGEFRSLNALCVRLVFCLYAEDAGIFGKHDMFHNYMEHRGVKGARKALMDLFHVLDRRPEERDPYLAEDDPELAAFPYVNGGLFSDESVVIPALTEEIYNLLLARASEDFDWSAISPTIFGAVFESTLNPETRRSGGMHYTSIENIHKVIDPLFLADLRSELDGIEAIAVDRTRRAKLLAFQKKLAGLKFLDPACGSGNFLTETYLSLRRLENRALSVLHEGQIVLDVGDPIQVQIGQFYGIEINDFAVTVARTALWIAESQMMKETEDVVHMSLDFLPLKTNAHIVEGNALRLDWECIVPRAELNYIMGNPPFVGYKLQTERQKADLIPLWDKAKTIDYVAGWYIKAAKYIQGMAIKAAFVSTNSITQGEQVPIIWKRLMCDYGIHIDFAYRTFIWESEAKHFASVHCVIIGFSSGLETPYNTIFYGNGKYALAKHINPYLVDADNVFIEKRSRPISVCEPMIYGSEPREGGFLILSPEERIELIRETPDASTIIKRFVSSEDFINNKVRYCLWFKNENLVIARKSKIIKDRLNKCREFRNNCQQKQAHAAALTPYLFASPRQPETDYLLIPIVSSENRRYIPIGYVSKDVIVSNACFTISNASMYTFGVLMSNVHMAWMRTVCGRLKSDYRYSNTMVYNNFPWPSPTDAQRAKIERTAQGVLDARALYPDCSLADLYDESTMPPELRTAHQNNDRAVWEAYGKAWDIKSEPDCVAALMRMYQKLASV